MHCCCKHLLVELQKCNTAFAFVVTFFRLLLFFGFGFWFVFFLLFPIMFTLFQT